MPRRLPDLAKLRRERFIRVPYHTLVPSVIARPHNASMARIVTAGDCDASSASSGSKGVLRGEPGRHGRCAAVVPDGVRGLPGFDIPRLQIRGGAVFFRTAPGATGRTPPGHREAASAVAMDDRSCRARRFRAPRRDAEPWVVTACAGAVTRPKPPDAVAESATHGVDVLTGAC